MCPVGIGTSRTIRKPNTTQAKLWLLLVGVNQYQDAQISTLRYSALDCQGLAEALSGSNLEFTEKSLEIYHDFAPQLPKLAAIRDSLNSLTASAQPQDTILFYFSGHGLLDSQTQQAVLCLSDTQKHNLLQTGLPLEELLSSLSKSRAQQQLVWLDACHSGGMTLRQVKSGEFKKVENSPISQFVEILEQQARNSKGFYALLSCDQGQQSWEFPELGHGVFTYYLMRGLRGEAANAQGVIEADSLYRYVYHQTLQYIDKTNQQLRLINQQKRGRGDTQLQSEYSLQTPKRIVEGVGELILGYWKASPTERYPRQALIVEGLTGSKTTLALSKILRGAGSFELEYWYKHKSALELQTSIQRILQTSEDVVNQTGKAPNLLESETATALLYLRGKISQANLQEPELILGDNIRLSRSWLRQQLRRATIPQQIIILDCPEATPLQDWVEDLQLGTEQGQCLIAATSPPDKPDAFAQTLLETLEKANQPTGLPVAGWISQLQKALAGTGIELDIWLSGAKGVIEVLPTRLSSRGVKHLDNFDLGICPYRGLQAFTVDDAPYFYGRESLTQQLINHLNQDAFLAVVGASGSGKSSLVQAGLVGQLKQGKQLPGSEQWDIQVMRPGEQPLTALAGCLNQPHLNAEQIEGILHLGVDSFVYFLRSRPEPVFVLVIDQFEELFTLASSGQRGLFLELVWGALRYASDRLKVVITLRADFITHALAVPSLATAIQKSSILIPPQLTQEAYREVIVNPAEQVGLAVEPELIDILLGELDNAAGDLPLLEFVLEQLWEHRQNAQLTLNAYLNPIGGLKGALERKAQSVYDSLDPQAQRCAQWIFLSLVQFGEGSEETKRRILKSDLSIPKYAPELIENTLSTLVAAKLIVIQGAREEKRAKGGGETSHWQPSPEQPTIEIAHEILIRYWSTLRWWLDENRTRLLKQRQLEQAAQLWLKGNQKPEYLLQGVRLAEAEEIYIELADELPEEIQRFIEACLAEKQRQRRETTNRLRRTQIAVAVISVMAIASTTLAGFAQQQKLAAQLREIDALNASAEALLTSHQQLEALTTSLKAASLLQRLPQKPQFLDTQLKTASTLQQTIALTQERNRLQVHRQKVNSVAFSPDGQRFASASDDNTVILWESNGQQRTTLKGKERFLSVAFSPDSQTLVTGDASGTVQLWHSDGTPIKTINAHSDWVTRVSFHPNSQQLVSVSRDGRLKLWSLDGRLLKTLQVSPGWVNDVTFSPKGQFLASAGEDGKIQLWNNQGQPIKTWQADNDRVSAIRFSPDGEILASVGGDNRLKLWDNGQLVDAWEADSEQINSVSWDKTGDYLVTASANSLKIWDREGTLIEILSGHGAEVLSASWHPEAAVIVSASTDKTVRLWKLNTIKAAEAVDKIAFSPNSQFFASAGWDGTINIYATQDQRLIQQIPIADLSTITSLSFSPDSQYIAASGDNFIQLWQVSNGEQVRRLNGHQGRVTSIQFSPNGQLLASGSEDKTVKLWSVKDGYLLNTLTGHTDGVTSLSWNSTGEWLASGSHDKTVRIWRSQGSEVKTLLAHDVGVSAIAFSPHANLLATASWDNTIKVWTLNGELKQTLTGHNNGVTSLNWHPTGEILASSSADGTIKLWHSGTLLKTLIGDAASVHQVLFSPEGNALLSAGEVTGANLQDLNLAKLIPQSCTQLQEYFNSNQSILEENTECDRSLNSRSKQR